MNRIELLTLRELVKAEKEREERFQASPETEHIQRYLNIINGNLYESEDDNRFDVQLVGCPEFDEENEDWACNEVFLLINQ